MRFDYIFKGIEAIPFGQVTQTDPKSIEIAVVPTAAFAKAHEEALICNVQAWISPTLRVTVKTVDSIPPGPSGKFQAVIGLKP